MLIGEIEKIRREALREALQGLRERYSQNSRALEVLKQYEQIV